MDYVYEQYPSYYTTKYENYDYDHFWSIYRSSFPQFDYMSSYIEEVTKYWDFLVRQFPEGENQK